MNQYGNVQTSAQQNQQYHDFLTFLSPSSKHAELFHDKCTVSIYVLDNSGSMGLKNGKMFIDEILIKQVSRWNEAVQRVQKIAQYNIERGQTAVYYLLNPQKFGTWVPRIDVVQIPAKGGNLQHLTPLLDSRNIRGNTPFTKITKHITSELIARMKHPCVHSYDPVCYNLITDGMPNNRISFTNSLRNMMHPSEDMELSIFITVNLCTDDENVIGFYNDLDTKLGTECCGLDVIDDWIGEANEIEQLNPFLTYSQLLHISRMSGCYSKIWDEVDEKCLNPAQIHSLMLELFPNIALPNFHDVDNLEAYRTTLEKAVKNCGKVQNSKGKYELPLNTNLAVKKIFLLQDGCCMIL